jgi:hypothetical protein
MVRRDGARVRCFTRNGNDWADRFPSIVEVAARLDGARKKSDELTIAIVPAGTSFSRRLAGSQYSTC